MISVFCEYGCLEAAKSNTKDTQRDCSVYQVLRNVNEHLPWNSVKVKEVWVFVNNLSKTFQSIRGFIFAVLPFSTTAAVFSSAIDCEKRFVSFCGSSPTFLPPLNGSVESQFISPRLQFLLFIVRKLVCIKMKRNHILICLELAWMW